MRSGQKKLEKQHEGILYKTVRQFFSQIKTVGFAQLSKESSHPVDIEITTNHFVKILKTSADCTKKRQIKQCFNPHFSAKPM